MKFVKNLCLVCLLGLILKGQAQVSLFEDSWLYSQRQMKLMEYSSTKVTKQKARFLQRKFKEKTIDQDKKHLRIKRRVKMRAGHIYSKEKYLVRGKIKIKVLKLDGKIYLLQARYKEEGYGAEVKSRFVYLGSKTWEWIYLTYNSGRKIYKRENITSWDPAQ